MKAATIEFLRQRFGDYYRRSPLSVPPALAEREFGLIFFDTSPETRMRRHIAFPTGTELHEYIRSLLPAHVYYSSAYYENPGAPTMDEKGWTGADLIFDLDADHIVRGPYSEMLARVKEEAEKLLSMLVTELGFDQRKIDLVFSGGRGYHIHVRELSTRGFSSSERRELINYVCGIGICPPLLLFPGSHSHHGWHGRYISVLTEYLSWLSAGAGGDEGPVGGVQHLSNLPGIGKETAGRFMKRAGQLAGALTAGGGQVLLREKIVAQVIGVLGEGGDEEFTKRLRGKAALADEPVTTDIKRLIRMPSSLHGGSGFRVTSIPVRDLGEFDPLTDAVVFGTRAVTVDLRFAHATRILGNDFRLDKGVQKVPEALAVYLCCRGIAEFGGGGAAS